MTPKTRTAASENLLGRETSPYLLQHKDNPVHWRPWGAGALDEARALNRPILLSIGYAACHWCHVMAHESFEDASTAAVMNDLFVNVKVDREERPDVDTIYMTALQLMGVPGGWPLTMFLTPDGAPFWGGTYFPKRAEYGQPAFVDVLRRISDIYRSAPDQVTRSQTALMEALEQQANPAPATGRSDVVTSRDLTAAADVVMAMVDRVQGGFGGAPKFPQTNLLELLWRAHRRAPDEAKKAAVTLTLTSLAQGGLYDHLAGGFARYAVDDAWLVPHFEKMLYDNALLIETMTAVWRETRSPLLKERITQTADWLLGDMVTLDGAFAASYDADSEGEEGKFYVWRAEEIADVLGAEEAAFFGRYYDVSDEGNWDGVTVLNRLSRRSLGDGETEERLARARKALRVARAKRVPPAWDDKVLADWNGLAIAALTEAAMTLGVARWLGAAERAYAFVSDHMAEGDRLFHSFRLGAARHRAMADDYVAMARAALVLFEATGAPEYLADAQRWTDTLNTHFWDRDDAGYFQTDDAADDLIVRSRTPFDSAVPNANGLMLGVLARLFHLTGTWSYRSRADALISAFVTEAKAKPAAVAAFWNGFDTHLNAVQIVLVCEPGDRAGEALASTAWMTAPPTRVLSRVRPGEALHRDHPAAGKTSQTAPTAFVCKGTRCSLPLTDPAALAKALSTAT